MLWGLLLTPIATASDAMFGGQTSKSCLDSVSRVDNSVLVCSMMSTVHLMQKIGRPVKPAFIFGIWKHFRPFRTVSPQRSQAVAFPQEWAVGTPVDMDNRDGVLPLGFVIQQPLVSAR